MPPLNRRLKQFATFILFFSTLLAAQTMHPTFPLLDADGNNVLQSGAAISTMTTCGDCHDTQYISENSFHGSVGFDQLHAPGKLETAHPWDTSPGLYGDWTPLPYRYLTPNDSGRFDMGTADWVQLFGARHVGGGPAQFSENGQLLTQNPKFLAFRELHHLDEQTGEIKTWNWQESGVVEMNCFLCHIQAPNNDARIAALENGNFGWANTATLAGIGIVEETDSGYRYSRQAFGSDGKLLRAYSRMMDPQSENCGFCHGLVHDDRRAPLVSTGCQANQWTTETTGQIISPQRISDSGMNLANKQELYRPWDAHAARVVGCTDCHFSLNNPVYYQESPETRPEHLAFTARRLEIDDYLYRPSHQFARGQSSYQGLAPRLQSTMRRCESCHNFEQGHEWLPYKKRHMNAVTCESCHIPKIYGPSRRVFDWTMIKPDGSPRMECRGVEGEPGSITALIHGYEPILLPRQEPDGRNRLAPFNMLTFYYWVGNNPERPARLLDLQKALLQDGSFHPDILAVLDSDADGELSDMELVLDSQEKIDAVASRLEAVGVTNPEIRGEIRPYGIHHNVAHGDWVTRDCQACHARDSRLGQAFLLAENFPHGSRPKLAPDANVLPAGLVTSQNSTLYFEPKTRQAGFYVLGHDSVFWVQVVGALSVIMVVLGVGVHGGFRVLASKKHQHEPHEETETVYMYQAYERFWHWLQALAIIGLIFTGIIIHAPDVFGVLTFDVAVWVHNVLAVILLLNAFLAFFYHIVSGEIRQFIPQPRGFFSQAVQQLMYYTKGIFRNEPHPFEKTRHKKLNPLQKFTYLIILNILLPGQVITGILIWGAQHWPNFASEIGGLNIIVPIHSLLAWFFAAFLIMHIYLTTTGHTPISAVKAMVTGYETVPASEESK